MTIKSIFSRPRVTLVFYANQPFLRAKASIIVADSMIVTGIRIIEGKYGLFLSMPQRKNATTGEYSDIAFPIKKEVRDELTALLVHEYEIQAFSKAPN